jgi:uncharacterized OB-fold protein
MTELTNQEVFDRLPDLWVDQETIALYRGMLQRQLLINRCADCATWHAPPWPICPSCWSDDVRPTPVSGKGIIYLLTILHTGVPMPGVDYQMGYPVAVVELEEQQGLRISATVVDCPKDQFSIGLPVELTWIERAGAPIFAFRPASL